MNLGEFGLGKSRSLADYEHYAGINFKLRMVQDYTREDHAPPNPEVYSDKDWEIRRTRDFTATILVRRDQLPSLSDVDFWYVGLHDKAGIELLRQDMLPDSCGAGAS